jgi:hypothetical protein
VRITEINVLDVYVAPMSLMMIAAWFVAIALRGVAARFGLASAKGLIASLPIDGDFRETRIWVKLKGNWKLALYQVTPVASEMAAAAATA